MSQLPPNAMAALQQLLGALASSDNTSRAQAEESLNNEWIAARPDMLLSGLAERARVADDPVVSFPSLPSPSFYFPPHREQPRSTIPPVYLITLLALPLFPKWHLFVFLLSSTTTPPLTILSRITQLSLLIMEKNKILQ